MIGYLKGEIIIIEKDHLILNVNDVGYQIQSSKTYTYHIGQKIEFFIYTHVKEDQFTLFGFQNLDEKNLFLQLISVKGVGPKTALNILTSIDYQQLIEAISKEDLNLIKKLPGIGPKSASQIILDLQGKLVVSTKVNQELSDALEALSLLGYKSSDLKKIESELSNQDLSSEEYVKLGLSLLLK